LSYSKNFRRIGRRYNPDKDIITHVQAKLDVKQLRRFTTCLNAISKATKEKNQSQTLRDIIDFAYIFREFFIKSTVTKEIDFKKLQEEFFKIYDDTPDANKPYVFNISEHSKNFGMFRPTIEDYEKIIYENDFDYMDIKPRSTTIKNTSLVLSTCLMYGMEELRKRFSSIQKKDLPLDITHKHIKLISDEKI
tara:strand:- start:10 stop:585 length:576 start_codon:yes stop_codon:yes gene_type:complete